MVADNHDDRTVEPVGVRPDGRRQGRVGVQRAVDRAFGLAPQLERVAVEDQRARPVPGVQPRDEVPLEQPRRPGRGLLEVQVAGDQDGRVGTEPDGETIRNLGLLHRAHRAQ